MSIKWLSCPSQYQYIILQAHFGQAELLESDEEEDVWIGEEKISETSEETTAKPKDVSNLAAAKVVFPFKSIPLVIVGIPDNLLPLHGPEIQSHYHCQMPQCGLDFAQKAAACNHVHHNHLNVALACLYCSFENNPHMRWYSATAWESHTAKHCSENLPNYPDDPEFVKKFQPQPGNQVTPSTSKTVTAT